MKTFVATVALAAAAASVADAHVYLTQPLAEFKAGASKSSWVAEFKNPFPGTTITNAAQYKAAAKGNLKSFLDDKGPTCGNSLANAKPKPIPSDGIVKFASTIEHPGPCEFWLDDTLAFQADDCEAKFAGATQFKMDFSACKGSCMLRFYWLGLQDKGGRWQSYKNCVPLGGGGSSGGASSGGNKSSGGDSTESGGNSKSNKGSSGNSGNNGNNNGNQNGNGNNSGNEKTKKPKTTKAPKKESRSYEDNYSFDNLDETRNLRAN